MEFKIRNRQRKILTHAPDRSSFEHLGVEYEVRKETIQNTLERLKKEHQYIEFFNVGIDEAVRRAKIYKFYGLIVATDDFCVIDKYGIPLDNKGYFRIQDSNIKNQTKRHNASNDVKLRIATGQRRVESFKLYAMGVKEDRSVFPKRK